MLPLLFAGWIHLLVEIDDFHESGRTVVVAVVVDVVVVVLGDIYDRETGPTVPQLFVA